MTAPAPLTDADVEAAFAALIWPCWLEHLDTRLGTVECVKWLKGHSSYSLGHTGDVDGLPYPENSRWVERDTKKGAHVRVYHGDRETPAREGWVPWNRLANMATIRACELRYTEREPAPGEQLELAL